MCQAVIVTQEVGMFPYEITALHKKYATTREEPDRICLDRAHVEKNT